MLSKGGDKPKSKRTVAEWESLIRAEHEEKWLHLFAAVALMEQRVTWSGWRRIGTAMGGRARQDSEGSYRVGVFDLKSPSGAGVLIGFRHPGQRDTWDVMRLANWREEIRQAGGVGDETLLLRELCEWAQGEVRKVEGYI